MIMSIDHDRQWVVGSGSNQLSLNSSFIKRSFTSFDVDLHEHKVQLHISITINNLVLTGMKF